MVSGRELGPSPPPGGLLRGGETRAAGDCVDDEGQVVRIAVSTFDLVQPPLSGGIAELNRVVGSQHEQPGISAVGVSR